MPHRYGVTLSGLVLAGGAGVYLGTVPVGYVAMIATAVVEPTALVALPGAVALGAVAGAVIAHATRMAIRPQMSQRYRRLAIAGAVTMPGYMFLSRLPGHDAAEWTVGFTLCCGIAAMVSYYRWRKQLALQRQPSHTA